METSGKRLVRAENLSTQVYSAIQEGITSGDLPSGERLVVDKLAREYGVSQTPVREALARLIQDGIVESVSPGRLRVVPVTREFLLDTHWVRSALEGLAAELASSLIAEESIEELREMTTVADEHIRNGQFTEYSEINNDIHWKIIRESRNRVLIRDLEGLQFHTTYIREHVLRVPYDHARRFSQANAEHAAIVDAISNRDSQEARTLTELHVRNSAERMSMLVPEETA